MKLWSGIALIAPRKFPLTAFAIMALGIGLSLPISALAQNTAGAPVTGEAPAAGAAPAAAHPKTEVALACIFGMAPKGCETLFVGGAARVFQRVVWRNGPNPYFQAAQYAGPNDGGDGVWDVKLMHSEETYVISQPNEDGKVQQLSIMQGAPNQQCDNEIPRGVANLGRIKASCGVLLSSSF
jgi:hypothetical protein